MLQCYGAYSFPIQEGEKKNNFCTIFIEEKREPIAATTEQSKQPSARGLFTPRTEMFVATAFSAGTFHVGAIAGRLQFLT